MEWSLYKRCRVPFCAALDNLVTYTPQVPILFSRSMPQLTDRVILLKDGQIEDADKLDELLGRYAEMRLI